ncbi:MAG: glycosyltransferase, partial [Candidatus Margulisbacteria bacterium]|nr:glycosyltransferase [Candidatus Margulisiibacteriota bacterium]
MNIAILSDTYHPQINGVVTSILTFAETFRKLGHQVLIMGPKIQGAEETHDVWRLRSVVFPFQPEYRLIWPVTRKVKAFGERNIDIIHAQTPFSVGLLGQYLGRKYRIPVIHTYHTLFSEYMHYVPIIPTNLADKAVSTVSRLFCNRCQTIVVPSALIKDKLMEYGVKKTIKILPTGIALDTIQAIQTPADFKSRLGFEDTHRVLIFVGRLGLEKNVQFLIKSFAMIHHKLPDTRLLIIGDGPEKENMKTTASQLGIG